MVVTNKCMPPMIGFLARTPHLGYITFDWIASMCSCYLLQTLIHQHTMSRYPNGIGSSHSHYSLNSLTSHQHHHHHHHHCTTNTLVCYTQSPRNLWFYTKESHKSPIIYSSGIIVFN